MAYRSHSNGRQTQLQLLQVSMDHMDERIYVEQTTDMLVNGTDQLLEAGQASPECMHLLEQLHILTPDGEGGLAGNATLPDPGNLPVPDAAHLTPEQRVEALACIQAAMEGATLPQLAQTFLQSFISFGNG